MKILAYKHEDHDSNFCYYDGEKVRYFQPERKHGIKHYGYYPMLEPKVDPFQPTEVFHQFNINPDELDLIVEVVDDPKNGQKLFLDPKVLWYESGQNIFGLPVKTIWVEHHWAHANSIWPISEPTEYSVVYDGVGNSNVHATIFHGEEVLVRLNRKACESVCFELQGLGKFCGITAPDGLDIPGKVMGFQSFGNWDIAKEIYDLLYASYTLDECPMIEYVLQHLDNYNPHDIAMAYQRWIESAFMDWVKRYVPTDATVSFTGGLAQNVLLNYKFSLEYKNLIIPPHCNDCGMSIGAIGAVAEGLTLDNFPFCQSDESPEPPSKKTLTTIAKELANGKIVAMYQGNGEVGPRALGNRSILMDPTVWNGKDIINERVKKRENYRPFGAAVMLEHVGDYFDWDRETPYMLHAVPVRDKSIESVTHVDGTCRIQTVKDGMMYDLLDEFYKITNVPVLLNTSLNLAGKPIAGTISEAEKLFNDVDIDILCYGNTILYK